MLWMTKRVHTWGSFELYWQVQWRAKWQPQQWNDRATYESKFGLRVLDGGALYERVNSASHSRTADGWTPTGLVFPQQFLSFGTKCLVLATRLQDLQIQALKLFQPVINNIWHGVNPQASEPSWISLLEELKRKIAILIDYLSWEFLICQRDGAVFLILWSVGAHCHIVIASGTRHAYFYEDSRFGGGLYSFL